MNIFDFNKNNDLNDFLNEDYGVEIIEEGEEVLNEYNINNKINHRCGHSISVHKDRGSRFEDMPYFKFCRGIKFDDSNKTAVARVPFEEEHASEYQIYKGSKGVHYNLNKDDFDALEEMLTTKSKNVDGTI